MQGTKVMEFGKTLDIAAAGLIAQNARIRIVAENLANADSLADTPGGEPYRRRLVTFKTSWIVSSAPTACR